VPTLPSILADLKSRASDKTRATYIRHGMASDRVLGVSIADLKTIAKTIKAQQSLALDLYATGLMEPMYLAGIVASGSKMTPEQLHSWAGGAFGLPMIAEYTVPWVAVESPQARTLAHQWIASSDDQIASSGWCTWSGLVATQPDAALDLAELKSLLAAIPKQLRTAKNRTRYTMNNFVISVGTYVLPLHTQAKAVAEKLGNVSVDVGDTACKVPLAIDYIAKVEALNRVGQKRKTIRC